MKGKSLNIRSILILMLLFASVGSILVIGYLSWDTSRQDIQQGVFDHLVSVRTAKAQHIEAYLRDLRSQLASLSEEETTIRSMVHFNRGFRQLNHEIIPEAWNAALVAYYEEEFFPRQRAGAGDGSALSYIPQSQAGRYLQYHYLAANPDGADAEDGSDYGSFHEQYHPIFRNLVERFGYADLLLVDVETEQVVYSVAKEVDFAARATVGPYAETGLAAVIQAVRTQPQKGVVQVVDFQPYAPAGNIPTSFFAAPIYNGLHMVGILVIQLPPDPLTAITTGLPNHTLDALGESGQTYLVGSDLRLRSIYPRTTGEDAPDGSASLLQLVDTAATRAAVAGETGMQRVDNVGGVPVLSAYQPLAIEGLDWSLMTEISLAEANLPVRAHQQLLLVSTAIVALVFTLLAIVLAALFMRPANRLLTAAQAVVAGKEEVTINVNTDDEFGRLGQALRQLQEKIGAQAEQLREKDHELRSLLENILPHRLAQRVLQGETQISEAAEVVTVLYAQFSGFVHSFKEKPLPESAAFLTAFQHAFEEAAVRHGLEPMRTIGNRSLAICGLETTYLDHAHRTVDLAFSLLRQQQTLNQDHGVEVALHIGIHTGVLLQDVAGTERVRYTLWGEPLHVASQLSARAEPNAVLITDEVHRRLEASHRFVAQGPVVIEEVGEMETWAFALDATSPLVYPVGERTKVGRTVRPLTAEG